MPDDLFTRALANARQIKITVTGRTTGRTITLPVWFVHDKETVWLLPVHGSKTQWYQNLMKNPAITINVGKQQRAFKAQTLKSASSVRSVVRMFGEKYKPEIITKLYPGPLDVAIKLTIKST